jgi:MHS family proline/betaine transporter-like MFS transporter
VQGLSAGGELGGAATMLAEASSDRLRGLVCSVAQIGALMGLLLASAVVSLTDLLLSPEDMLAFVHSQMYSPDYVPYA